uniref:Uncharacterized protein n=1 Tax=Romanomermis culicivorax TaxID=13658 RepID=A0A915J8G7_ROMCU
MLNQRSFVQQFYQEILIEHLLLMFRLEEFLRDFPGHKAKFALLSQANLDDESKLFDNGEFEKVATNYFHVFDDLMTEIENNAGNMDNAIDALTGVGKKNKRSPEFTLESYKAMEEPFLTNVRDVLEDRCLQMSTCGKQMSVK